MKFIGRENELQVLENEYNNNSSFVVLYGRRRIGKTRLIQEFIKDKDALFFFASEELERVNMNRFTSSVSDYINKESMKTTLFSSWDTIFDELVSFQPERKLL